MATSKERGDSLLPARQMVSPGRWQAGIAYGLVLGVLAIVMLLGLQALYVHNLYINRYAVIRYDDFFRLFVYIVLGVVSIAAGVLSSRASGSLLSAVIAGGIVGGCSLLTIVFYALFTQSIGNASEWLILFAGLVVSPVILSVLSGVPGRLLHERSQAGIAYGLVLGVLALVILLGFQTLSLNTPSFFLIQACRYLFVPFGLGVVSIAAGVLPSRASGSLLSAVIAGGIVGIGSLLTVVCYSLLSVALYWPEPYVVVPFDQHMVWDGIVFHSNASIWLILFAVFGVAPFILSVLFGVPGRSVYQSLQGARGTPPARARQMVSPGRWQAGIAYGLVLGILAILVQLGVLALYVHSLHSSDLYPILVFSDWGVVSIAAGILSSRASGSQLSAVIAGGIVGGCGLLSIVLSSLLFPPSITNVSEWLNLFAVFSVAPFILSVLSGVPGRSLHPGLQVS